MSSWTEIEGLKAEVFKLSYELEIVRQANAMLSARESTVQERAEELTQELRQELAEARKQPEGVPEGMRIKSIWNAHMPGGFTFWRAGLEPIPSSPAPQKETEPKYTGVIPVCAHGIAVHVHCEACDPAKPKPEPSQEGGIGDSKSLYDIPLGCICVGDGLMGMPCTASTHAKLKADPSDPSPFTDREREIFRVALKYQAEYVLQETLNAGFKFQKEIVVLSDIAIDAAMLASGLKPKEIKD
jgi:hypothetical protein